MKDNKNVKVRREYKVINGNKVLNYEYHYDNKGNKIYEKNYFSNEYYWEYKYDDKGHIVYYKDFTGNEYHREYDNKGNLIYEKDFDGNEYHIKSTTNERKIRDRIYSFLNKFIYIFK